MTGIRIGDAERDAAVGALADHYATGRLAKDEYDERADRANAARFEADLAPLFADLPATTPAWDESTAAHDRRRHPASAAPVRWLAPALTIGMIALVATAVVLDSPWLLFVAFWMVCGLGGNRSRHHHGWIHPRQRA